MSKNCIFILSCEHASNLIPDPYASFFSAHTDTLSTHWAYDIGAHSLALQLSQYFNAPYFSATASRLLIDCNRSLKHPKIFSSMTKSLPLDVKKEIIEQYYLPYRSTIQDFIDRNKDAYQIFHLSVHSFTPILNNHIRKADIGLLYNPAEKVRKRSYGNGFILLKTTLHPLKFG